MGIVTNPVNAPGGIDRDNCDYERLRHARERSQGFPVGQYLQPPPMLFTRDGHNVFLGDMYRGRSAFLVCGGPSLTSHDLTLLSDRGILTMAVNNAATVVRPNLWCSVDDPGNFSDAIWYDPGITKFVPLCHMEKTFTVRNARGELINSSDKVGDMPAVFGYRRNEAFVAEQFLTEDTFNWGNHGNSVDALGNKGSRSVMYVAVRLLYYLGIRTIYLLGCDFRMQVGVQNYAFEQARSSASVKGNNESYAVLNSRFSALAPIFAGAGLRVFNCTPNSGLSAFPAQDYEAAVEEATAVIPKTINTAGMYDRKARASNPKSQSCRNTVDSSAVDPSDYLRDFPEVTLVIPINRGDAASLHASWRTWVELKPWIARFRVLVLQHPDTGRDAVTHLLASADRMQIDVMNVDNSLPNAWERAKVVDIAHRVETEWFWMLEPTAVATSKLDWLSPSVFSRDETDREPVFTGCRWGYTKPANTYQRLDEWAGGIELFRDHPPLNWPADPTADRIQHGAVSTWSFLARTSWVKMMSSVVDRHAPLVEHSSFMLFCAERRRERVHRVSMKRFGWDHSFGWTAEKVEQRCRNVLSSPVEQK